MKRTLEFCPDLYARCSEIKTLPIEGSSLETCTLTWKGRDRNKNITEHVIYSIPATDGSVVFCFFFFSYLAAKMYRRHESCGIATKCFTLAMGLGRIVHMVLTLQACERYKGSWRLDQDSGSPLIQAIMWQDWISRKKALRCHCMSLWKWDLCGNRDPRMLVMTGLLSA